MPENSYSLAALPSWFLVTCAFIFGALVGSFLNVVIARVPHGKSIIRPPSHCFSCKKPIAPYHNIPILSWLILRGRCANCGARFSVRYALIELAFGAVCAFAVWRHGLSLPAAREILMMGLLVPLTAMDLDTWLLPRSLTVSGIVLGLALAGAEALLGEGWRHLGLHAFAAALGYSVLALVGFIGEKVMRKEAMGRGDPWLFAMIGAFLGPLALLPTLLFASVQGSLIGGALIFMKRRREKRAAAAPAATLPKEKVKSNPQAEEEDDWTPDPTAVPFGPFLSLGAAEVLYFPGVMAVLFPPIS